MIVALDANIVIYLIEANPIWTSKASARLTALRASGDEIAFAMPGVWNVSLSRWQWGRRPMSLVIVVSSPLRS
jgi:hypothetical protein